MCSSNWISKDFKCIVCFNISIQPISSQWYIYRNMTLGLWFYDAWWALHFNFNLVFFFLSQSNVVSSNHHSMKTEKMEFAVVCIRLQFFSVEISILGCDQYLMEWKVWARSKLKEWASLDRISIWNKTSSYVCAFFYGLFLTLRILTFVSWNEILHANYSHNIFIMMSDRHTENV